MISVERLRSFSQDDLISIGRLRPYLSKHSPDTAVDETMIKHIIDSPDHEQIVARSTPDGKIVGVATLTHIAGSLKTNKAWLEDFVVDPTTEVRGIGQLIWNEIELWCKERNLKLEFTSHQSRIAAQKFYAKQGAVTRETTVLVKNFDEA